MDVGLAFFFGRAIVVEARHVRAHQISLKIEFRQARDLEIRLPANGRAAGCQVKGVMAAVLAAAAAAASGGIRRDGICWIAITSTYLLSYILIAAAGSECISSW